VYFAVTISYRTSEEGDVTTQDPYPSVRIATGWSEPVPGRELHPL